MFVVQICCLYFVNRLLYGVLPETTFFDKNGRTWPQFDLYNFWPWVTSGKIFQRMRRIDARRGTENFKALFPTEFELLAKNQRGALWAPPPSSVRGLKLRTPYLVNLLVAKNCLNATFYCISMLVQPGADPADRFFWGGGKSWRRGPKLPPFSSFSTDLGHFILKLLNFDIFMLNF